jgi:hypothetical protein
MSRRWLGAGDRLHGGRRVSSGSSETCLFVGPWGREEVSRAAKRRAAGWVGGHSKIRRPLRGGSRAWKHPDFASEIGSRLGGECHDRIPDHELAGTGDQLATIPTAAPGAEFAIKKEMVTPAAPHDLAALPERRVSVGATAAAGDRSATKPNEPAIEWAFLAVVGGWRGMRVDLALVETTTPAAGP